MKKLFVVLVVITFIASFASAQEIWGQGKMSAGVGAELALPLGVWGDFHGIGIGGFGLFQYGVTPEILLTGQIGYTTWMEKEVGLAKYSSSVLIILPGAKYNFSDGLYGMLQLGVYSLTQKYTVPASTFFGIPVPAQDVSLSSSEFVILPGIGYQMGNLDACVKYTIKGDFGNVCLNVAYVMPL